MARNQGNTEDALDPKPAKGPGMSVPHLRDKLAAVVVKLRKESKKKKFLKDRSNSKDDSRGGFRGATVKKDIIGQQDWTGMGKYK